MQKHRLLRMPKAVHKPIQRILKAIQTEFERIDKQLDKLVEAIPQWRNQRDLLMSAKGVDKVVAYTLMSELPELGKLNRKHGASSNAASRRKSYRNARIAMEYGQRGRPDLGSARHCASNPHCCAMINPRAPELQRTK